ncbi:helix-turn-helix domain-containing protein [Herbiconiux sp. YIM B11900]|uniref:helix-turn-helix domain-containing protein n=1 Tax=Herbiconiux sp. YIM B11900 TaxID=3404131 RepID=UPI003F82FC76
MSDSREDEPADGGVHRIRCHLDAVLAERGMTLTELSARTGITMANLSILKNNRAKAIRFTTLTLVCDALGCTPAELFSLEV